MFIGTQYYRPPHPRRKDWKQDLRNIVDTGMSVIRIWVYWSQVNPRPGRWVWDDVDAFFEAAQEHGLRVLVQLMPDAMPYWFSDAHPEALFRDGNGNPVKPSANGACAVGGQPGPNYDHPAALEAGGEFISRTVHRYATHTAMYAWDIWNELWPFVIWQCSVFYNDATIEKWHRWLEGHYGDIEALNHHWMRSYISFDEVEWPTKGVNVDLGTRGLFDQQRVADWMHWRVELTRKYDPDHRVVAHTGGIGPVAGIHNAFEGDLTDPWLFTESLDTWGTSCYLPDFYQWSFLLDSTRSSAQSKPYWLFENNGGRGHYQTPGPGFYSNYLRSGEEVRTQVLLTFSHGGEGVVFWQWRPEHFGPESPGWGLTTSAGDLTERTEALRGLNRMLKKHAKLIDNAEFAKPKVAIIWDHRSYQAERLARWKPEFGNMGPFELFGYHKALISLGYSVEYLNARSIVKDGIPDHVKLIFHPYPAADRVGLAALIEAWVKQGGMFVAGPGVGLFDEKLDGSSQIPPDEWVRVLGVRQHEFFYPQEPRMQLLPQPLAGTTSALPGYHLVEAYKLEGAQPLGTWGSQTVLAVNHLGKGQALAVGSFLGEPVSIEGKWDVTPWLATLCAEAGIPSQPIHVVGENVFYRLAKSGSTWIVCVHNTGSTSTWAWMNTEILPSGASVENLVSGEAMGDVAPDRPLCLQLAAKDSAVYALRPLE